MRELKEKMINVNYRLLWNDFAFRYFAYVSKRVVLHPLRFWAARSYFIEIHIFCDN